MKAQMSASRLRELVHYDAATGAMTHKRSIAGRPVGTPATYITPTGYASIKLDGVRYYVHRLAWLYLHGEWPAWCIDHINGMRDDNRGQNLRDVTHSINNLNLRAAKSHNKLGVLGVQKKRNGFAARLAVNGKTKCLGTYATPMEASAAYRSAKQAIHTNT